MLKIIRKITTLVFLGIGFAVPALAQSNQLLMPPTGVTIDIINQKDVIILWEETGDQRVKEFIVLRTDTQGVAPTEVARVPVAEASYVDSTVQVGRTYTYIIRSYAAGYTASDSEAKSVLVKENDNFATPVAPPATAENGAPAPAAAELAPDDGRFWINLLSVNAVVIGALVLVYLFLRSRFQPANPTEMQHKAALHAKMGNPDAPIRAEASSRFLQDRAKKLSDWIKVGKD
jgi:hypothetical protein